jgi:hypothetical protein
MQQQHEMADITVIILKYIHCIRELDKHGRLYPPEVGAGAQEE